MKISKANSRYVLQNIRYRTNQDRLVYKRNIYSSFYLHTTKHCQNQRCRSVSPDILWFFLNFLFPRHHCYNCVPVSKNGKIFSCQKQSILAGEDPKKENKPIKKDLSLSIREPYNLQLLNQTISYPVQLTPFLDKKIFITFIKMTKIDIRNGYLS